MQPSIISPACSSPVKSALHRAPPGAHGDRGCGLGRSPDAPSGARREGRLRFPRQPRRRTGAGAGDPLSRDRAQIECGLHRFRPGDAARERNGLARPPKIILNAPTRLMKEQEYGAGYQYDHDTPEAFSGRITFPKAWGGKLLRPARSRFSSARSASAWNIGRGFGASARPDHQPIGLRSRKKPPVGPPGGSVAAQTIPAAPKATSRVAPGPPMSVLTPPRADRVDHDPAGLQLIGERAGQLVEPGLRSAISEKAGAISVNEPMPEETLTMRASRARNRSRARVSATGLSC